MNLLVFGCSNSPFFVKHYVPTPIYDSKPSKLISRLPSDFCRTPGYKMGRCVSIYECDYLLDILTSNSLTQQSITFLKLSQCDAGRNTQNIPHVCCARNDDSLMLSPNAGDDDGIHDKSLDAPSAVNTAASDENRDDSIIYKSSNGLLPKKNECGREKIENRIYNGQVSAFCCCRWRLCSCLLEKLTNYLFGTKTFFCARRKVKALETFFLSSMSSFQNTEREEFPWLALLEYRKGERWRRRSWQQD